MGRRHREMVWELPPGLVTADERLVLLALADKTNDDRMEWAHDRSVLMPMLGLDPDEDKDHEWLRRRLQALDEAGLIIRRPQRREKGREAKTKPGTWHRVSIKLDIENRVMDDLRPTPRAANERQKKHLAAVRPDPAERTRDKAGRFTTEAPPHSDSGPVPHSDSGPVPHSDSGSPPHRNSGTRPDLTGHRPDIDRTDDDGPVVAFPEDVLSDPERLADAKQAAKQSLARLTAKEIA